MGYSVKTIREYTSETFKATVCQAEGTVQVDVVGTYMGGMKCKLTQISELVGLLSFVERITANAEVES